MTEIAEDGLREAVRRDAAPLEGIESFPAAVKLLFAGQNRGSS